MTLFSQMRRKQCCIIMTYRKEFVASLCQLWKILIPTVKFGKHSVMVWVCMSSKGVGVIMFLNEIMTMEVYLDSLKNELITSIKNFGFIDPVNSNKYYYKYY